MQHFDVVIIGTGPGGEGAAMRLAKAGKRVAVVEKQSQLGGGCTHQGTIPSKALRHSVQLLADYRHHPLFAHTVRAMDVTWPQLLQTSDSVIAKQVSMRHRYYTRNRIAVFHGHAALADANTVVVTSAEGKQERLQADHVVIATGSRPYRPADVDFSHPRVLDSDTVLKLDHTPWRVCVDIRQPRPEGEPGQHPGPAAVFPGRRDHRRAQLPPARPGRADHAQRDL